MKNGSNARADISSAVREFTVRASELDMNGITNMPVICNYLQEIGITHGSMIVEDAGIVSNDMVFVLTRLNVRMERYPSTGERFTVRSWLSPITGRYIIRNFLIYDMTGGIIGSAINSAVAFDMKNRTGGTVSGDLANVQTLDAEPALPHVFEKLQPVIMPDYQYQLDVRYFDCDLYRHVNNVKYVEWCIETLPIEYIRDHKLYEIDINFRTEGNIGDKLTVNTCAGQEMGVFNHTITADGSDKELIRMKSIWK